MSENQDLRKENQDLFSVRDMLLRDQELVCKENERLLRKLEEVNTYVNDCIKYSIVIDLRFKRCKISAFCKSCTLFFSS